MRTTLVRSGLVMVALITGAVAMLSGPAGATDPDAKSIIKNGSGQVVGVAKLSQTDDGTSVKVAVENLSPGFHGFHVHAVGSCVAPAFTSSGGHYNTGTASHGGHTGDLPVILVNGDGTGEMRFVTDAFDVSDVVGRAFVIHAAPDNYGNVPVGSGATQYTPNSTGTDNTTATGLTANTGNAGARSACGVITLA